MELGKTPPIPFNIFKDVRYHDMKVVGNETTFQLLTAGPGKLMNKFNLQSIEKKKKDVGPSNVSTYISLQFEPQIWLFLHAKSFNQGVL
jgi:hypothetical protein